jgi:hypothetical protein
MKWKEAIGLLEDCERGLRKLVAETASSGDYANVHKIANLARAVAALAAEGRETPKDAGLPLLAAAALMPASAVARKSRAAADAYPKFFRRGNELVKVGWSKKDRKEYNHRAPRAAVDAAAAAVRQVGAKGKMFNGDALIPLKDAGDNAAIPDYQAYVALAWLKQLGVIEQHGKRGGYTLVMEMQIDSKITAAWPELAEWRG